MTTLENFAKDMFEKYSRKKTGKTAMWARLSDERKLEWLKDAFIIAEYVITEIKNKYRKPPILKKAMTSYESGFNHAAYIERTKILDFITSLAEELKEDLEEFQDRRKNVR